MEINIYSSPDRGGWCVTLPVHMGWWIPNGANGNGWYGFYYIKDIWVGSAVPYPAQACYSGGCPLLPAGYNFSYTNPPYAANQPGWWSIYNP